MDPWNAFSTATSFLSTKDITLSQVLAAKKALQVVVDNSDTVLPIVQLCLACSDNDTYTIKELLAENKSLLNTLDSKGLTPLIYAICFNNTECIELLLAFNVDCNEPDNLVGWTPAMWATHLDHVDTLERLVSYQADPLKKVGKSMKNAVSLMKPGSKCEEYLKIHGYTKVEVTEKESGGVSSNFKDLSIESTKKSTESKFINDNEFGTDQGYLPTKTFNFNNVERGQYVEFTDDSIRGILDYVFNLYQTHHSKPIYPSSIIFQCMRYAEHHLQSGGMVQNLIDLYLTRIRGIIGTQSGFVQFFGAKERKELEKKRKKEKDTTPLPPQVDIVTISYWISALNHLYYFLIRDSACNFLVKYPNILQELINTIQSLILKLAFIIDARLEPFLEPCLLEHTSGLDMDVSYKNDWKIFKNKQKNTKTSYEEIIDMLYPPSYSEQMKPSPIKVIQTLGALVYVLELYHISDVIKQQCLAAVFYYIGTHLFNRIMSSKKYCSRLKAMEIRLNISCLEDWLRANDFKPFIEEDGDFNTLLSWRGDGFPDKLCGKPVGFLNNVCRYYGDKRDPADATYFMNPLSTIGSYCLKPVIELTEWLQVMSVIQDMDGLKDILENFEILASSTMVECTRKYHYEVDEKKFSKTLKKWLKENSHNENVSEMEEKGMFYKDGTFNVLNQSHSFAILLPNNVQILHQYGADFKHIDNRKLLAYQPHIPLEIRDGVETIIDDSNDDQHDGYQYNTDTNDEESSAEEIIDDVSEDEDDNSNVEPDVNATLREDNVWNTGTDENTPYPYTENANSNVNSNLFKNITAPSSTARKTWDDDGLGSSNPWA